MSKSRFANNVALYTAANFLHRGAIFLSIPLFTRVLSQEDYGRWSLILSAYTLVAILFDLGISKSIPRLFYDNIKSDTQVKGFITDSILTRLALLVLFGLLFSVFGADLATWLSSGNVDFSALLFPFLLLVSADVFTSSVLAFIRAGDYAAQFCIVRIVSTVSQIGLGLLLLWRFEDPVFGLSLGYAFGVFLGSIISIAFLSSCFKYFPKIATAGFSLALINYGAPLVLHDLATWARSYSDVFLIARFLSVDNVGLYSVAMMSGQAVGLLALSFDLAYAPMYYRVMRSGEPRRSEIVASISNGYLALMMMVVSIPILFASEIYTLFFPASYAVAAELSPIIALSFFVFVIYTVEIKPLFLHKKTSLVPLITLVPTFLGILTNIAVIQIFGLTALPFSWLCVFFLMAAFAHFVARRYECIPIKHKRLIIFLALGLGFVLVGKEVTDEIGFNWLVARFLILVLIIGICSKIVLSEISNYRNCTN